MMEESILVIKGLALEADDGLHSAPLVENRWASRSARSNRFWPAQVKASWSKCASYLAPVYWSNSSDFTVRMSAYTLVYWLRALGLA